MTPGSRVGVEGAEVNAGLARDLSQEVVGRVACNEEVSRAEITARTIHAAHVGVSVEEQVHRLEAVVQAPVEDVAEPTLRHLPGRVDRCRDRRKRNGDRLVHRVHTDAHELCHVVGGHVVRTDRSSVTIPGVGVVRIVGLPQEPADESPLRLSHRHHVRAGAVHSSFVGEVAGGSLHLDPLAEELVHHLRCGEGIVLLRRDQERHRRSFRPALRLPFSL